MKTKMLFFIIISFSIIISCSLPEKPTGTSWETQINLSLINETYRVIDLVDSTNIYTIDDEMIFSYETDVQEVHIDDQMNINAKSSPEIPIYSNFHLDNQSIPIDETGFIDEQGDDIEVSYGLINSCNLQFEVSLEDDESLDSLEITFHDIHKPNGEALVVSITNFHNITSIDLQNHTIGNPSSDFLQELTFSVHTISSVNYEDYIGYLRIFFEDHMEFKEILGVLYNKTMPVEDGGTVIDIAYPGNLEHALEIPVATLTIGVDNELGFDVSLVGNILCINEETSDTVTIILDDYDLSFAAASTMNEPQYTEVSITDSVFGELVNIMPTRFDTKDCVFIIGRDNYSEPGFAYEGARATGTAKIDAPFLIRINETEIEPDSLIHIEVTEDNIERIEENIDGSELKLFTENKIPIGGSIDLYFSTNENEVFSNPGLTFKDNHISASSNIVSENELNIDISEEDILYFANPDIYMGMRIRLDESNGSVSISSSDYITIKGQIKLNLTIEVGEED